MSDVMRDLDFYATNDLTPDELARVFVRAAARIKELEAENARLRGVNRVSGQTIDRLYAELVPAREELAARAALKQD